MTPKAIVQLLQLRKWKSEGLLQRIGRTKLTLQNRLCMTGTILASARRPSVEITCFVTSAMQTPAR